MTRLFLMLDKIQDIKKFYSIIQDIPFDVYLQQQRYVVNAHSIMGIFSLDLSKVVTFISEYTIEDEIIEQLKEFSVDN